MNWIKKGAKTARMPKISDDIKELEFDEMWHFLERKENQKWIFKAVDRVKKKTIAWVTGKHDVATFKKLYDPVKHLKKCKYYTDGWSGFAKVLPKRRHVIGKKHTTTIEQNNSNTRHYLGRIIRRTKIVSKTEEMLNASLKLLFSLSFDGAFEPYYETFSTIFA
ncbi:hypothetical protein FACS189449_11290 [Alphaproteobacteria bacterium]|nr:hypothetical protein FACS189449_11290 [Alphaproteobacteria bacterium]